MKKRNDLEESCALCEYSQEIFGGDYYICKKKGVMEPGAVCRAFCFDPLKIKVSVRKIPTFKPLGDLLVSPDSKKEEAK
ncbi:MAG: hypothetical protein E7580_05260 [Ruminococcaceae bacterium]|nr:hypothetical protein [Oscillospiraceae bacterium]